MRVSLWEHYQARQAEHQLIFSSSQAAKGFSQELGHLLRSRKPAFAIDLVDHIYRIYDLKKHFEDCAIPQFQKFVEVLQLNDDRGFMDKVKQLNVGDLVIGFVIPGVQIVTASLAVMRLYQALSSTERLSPEQEFIINVVEKAFQGHQKCINEQFKVLKEHLDSNQAELTEELKQLRSDIGCIGIELCKLVQNAKMEIKEQLHSQNFRDFKFEVDNIAGTWRERDRTFWGQFATIPEEKKEQKALAYLAELEAALDTCKDKHLNGLTPDGFRKWKPRFALECLAEGAQYVTGALAQELGMTEQVSNLHLFTTLCKSLLRLKRRCIYETVRQRLNHLSPQLEELRNHLIKLSNMREPILRSVLQIREDYIQEILKITEWMHTIALTAQQTLVRHQIDTLLPAHEAEWLGAKRVGERKFFISNLVHHSPITSEFTPDLVSLDYTIQRQMIHSEAKRIGYWGAGVGGLLGIPAGPGGVAVLGGIGGGATYAVSAIGGLGINALGNGTLRLLGIKDIRVEKQREIKQILNIPLQSVMAKERSSWGSPGDWQFELRVDYSNQYRKYEVAACKLSHKIRDTLFEACEEHTQLTNARPFIAFKIEGDFDRYHSLTHRLLFAPRSIIQREDVERIAPSSHAKDYAQRSHRMLRSYFGYLRYFQNGTAMAEDNSFKTIARDSHFIHSATGEFLPLALSKTFLQTMEQTLLTENFELMATETGSLVPSFHFRKEPLRERYEFLLEYKFVNPTGGKLEEYSSFQLATFDNAVVESFKQVTFQQQGDSYDYAIGDPNLQEFLLQAFYGNLFGLGLPGKGTTRLQKANLFIPREVSFPGLHELFSRNPNRALHYTTEFAGENSAELFSGSPVQQRGRQSFRFWLDAQKGKRKPESLQKIAHVYAQKLHLARALFELFSNVDSESLDEILERRLGLFSPAKPELAHAHALLRKSRELPQFYEQLQKSKF